MPLQLGLGLNRRLGGFNPFNPTHLNPHLLFDTRTSMLGELESPTLDLDAAVPSSLDVITATRSGVATYTDINGVIQSADPNTVRVDYTQGEELTPTVYQRVGYTDFSSGWILDGATKTNQSTPYGDGVLLTQDTSSGEHNIIIIISNTGQHTFSLKVKPNGVTKLSLSLQSSSANSEVAYDTVAGTATIQGSNVSDASIKDLGGGWFLVKLTNDSVVERARIRLRNDANLTSYVGDGASGLFLANPQVEEGTTATDFVPNTTGSPKFITGATFGPRVPMMLIEPSATNLFTYSEDFTQWSLGKEGTGEFPVVTSDYADGPLGGLSDRIQFSTGGGTTGSDGSDVRLLPTVANGTAYTYSVWLKSLSGSVDVKLLVQSSGSFTATVTPEWQKFTYQFTGGFNGQRIVRIGIKGNDTTTADILAWGAQLEEGSVATSYIPTSGSTVTRNADNLVIDGSNFTDFYNATEGTVYVESLGRILSSDNYFLAISNNGAISDSFRLFHNSVSGFNVKTGGVTQVAINSGTVSLTSLNRGAFSYATNNFKSSMNGASEASYTSGSLPPVNQLQIGWGKGSNQLNGHIKRLIYWPTHSDSL